MDSKNKLGYKDITLTLSPLDYEQVKVRAYRHGISIAEFIEGGVLGKDTPLTDEGYQKNEHVSLIFLGDTYLFTFLHNDIARLKPKDYIDAILKAIIAYGIKTNDPNIYFTRCTDGKIVGYIWLYKKFVDVDVDPTDELHEYADKLFERKGIREWGSCCTEYAEKGYYIYIAYGGQDYDRWEDFWKGWE